MTEILNKINKASSVFYCQHILDSINNLSELCDFTASNDNGTGVIEYLKNASLYEEDANLSRTYIIRDKKTDDIVGYFSLKSGLASVNERLIKDDQITFDTIPAIELANFAVNNTYKNKHPKIKEIGTTIFMDFILPIVKYISEYIGVTILIIYALPYESLIKFYQKIGFLRLDPETEQLLHNRVKPYYDHDCIFMFQKI